MDLSQKTVRQLIEEVYGTPAPAEKSNSLMRSFSPGESFQLGRRFANASREFERLVFDALHDTHWWARAGTSRRVGRGTHQSLRDTDSLPERLMLLSLHWLDSYFFATRTG